MRFISYNIKLLLAAAMAATSCATLPPCQPERDAQGRIARSRAAINQFKQSQPCPSTGLPTGACPGWVVDHIKPLCECGADQPSNFQWQTVEEAKRKDRLECKTKAQH